MGAQPLGSRYLLDERIGQGGMGVVWRGHDRTTGTAYAIKVLRPEYASDPAAVGRFVRERTALVAFRHPNVVSVHDTIVEGSQLALVMDLVPGGDLAGLRKAQGGRLAPAQAASLAAQIADGLAAAHAAGIVHRDLKPANALFNNGQVLLADFGIALLASEPQFTTAGQVLGTATYLPPEVISGHEPGPAGDVYALGITLYELIAGQPPFTGNTAAILHAQVSAVPPRVPGIPDALWAVIGACLAKDPASRPPATGVAAALHAFAPGQPAPVGQPAPGSQPPEWSPGAQMWPDPLQAVRAVPGTGERPPLAVAPRSTAPKARKPSRNVIIGAVSAAVIVVLAIVLVTLDPFRPAAAARQQVHLASAGRPATHSASAAATPASRKPRPASSRTPGSRSTAGQQVSSPSPGSTQPSAKPSRTSKPGKPSSRPSSKPSPSSSPSSSAPPGTGTDAGGLPVLYADEAQEAHVCTVIGSAYDGNTGVKGTVQGIVCVDIVTSVGAGGYTAEGQLELYCQTPAGADVQCADAIAQGALYTAIGGATASTGPYQCGHSYGPCATGRNYVKTSSVSYTASVSSCWSSFASTTDAWAEATSTQIELPGSGTWVSLSGVAATDRYYICP